MGKHESPSVILFCLVLITEMEFFHFKLLTNVSFISKHRHRLKTENPPFVLELLCQITVWSLFSFPSRCQLKVCQLYFRLCVTAQCSNKRYGRSPSKWEALFVALSNTETIPVSLKPQNTNSKHLLSANVCGINISKLTKLQLLILNFSGQDQVTTHFLTLTVSSIIIYTKNAQEGWMWTTFSIMFFMFTSWIGLIGCRFFYFLYF